MSLNAAMAARIAAAKKVGPNMNEAQTGGGGTYTPPAAGKGVRLRLVDLVEMGNHTEQGGQFAGKKNNKVLIGFELSGKHWPTKEIDGKQVPEVLHLGLKPHGMNMSLNEKATFFKLFKVMNEAHGGEATIMAELLGKEFIGDIEHKTKGEGANAKTYANLVNIRKAEKEDDDENMVPIKVAEPISPLRLFIWDVATMEDWDALFIDGILPERKNDKGEVTHKAKSKNWLQDTIRTANNFDTLPIAGLLRAGATAEDEKSLDEAIGGADNDDKPPFPTEGEADIDDCV